MGIHNKPFNISEKIKRVIFGGRPKYFNATDLNKYLDLLNYGIRKNTGSIGATGTINVAIQSIDSEVCLPTGSLQFSISYAVSQGYIMYDGVTFEFPSSSATHTEVVDMSDDRPIHPTFYWVLKATESSKDFSSEPELCGIQADEFPNSVPSCNVDVYEHAQLVITANPSNITNKICVIGALTPTMDDAGELSVEYVNYLKLSENISILRDNIVEYNRAELVTDGGIFGFLNVMYRDTLKRFSPNFLESTLNTYHNKTGSVHNSPQWSLDLGIGNTHSIDLGAVAVVKTITPHSSYRDGTPLIINITTTSTSCQLYGTSGGGKFITDDGESIAIRPTDLLIVVGFTIGSTRMWYVLSTLDARYQMKKFRTEVTASFDEIVPIPLGGIITYSGSISANFSATGLGVGGCLGWAICNGQTHGGLQTPDLRGRFIVGAVKNIPNDGTIDLEANIDPTQLTDGAQNPNYELGQNGGKHAHKLGVTEIPAHKHNVTVAYVRTYPSSAALPAATKFLGGGSDWALFTENMTGTVQQDTIGGGLAHENKPPYYVLVYLIRVPIIDNGDPVVGVTVS